MVSWTINICIAGVTYAGSRKKRKGMIINSTDNNLPAVCILIQTFSVARVERH
jgi:hypothetical protein